MILIATCQTETDPNTGLPCTELGVAKQADVPNEQQVIICGVCGQPITDVHPAAA